MNQQELALSFISLGYNDYIAARILLNNNYPLQGLTLASSAVEKYIKVILALNGKTKEEMKGHMDSLNKLKSLLASCSFDITRYLDDRFLNLLAKAYKARYYDNLSAPIMIGFFVNQVICELDYTINIFNRLIKTNDLDGNIIKTNYKRAVEEKIPELITNNFLFMNTTKKEFIERPDQGFGIYIDSVNGFREIAVTGKDVINKYEGTLTEINLEFE